MQVGRDVRGPRVVVGDAAEGDGLELLPGGGEPAVARQRREAARRFAVERHHQVMERRIRLAVRRAAHFLGGVLGSVPAAYGEIDAADESDRIVDHHDLLVMRAGQRMRVVVAQVHAARGRPAEAVERRKLPVGAEHHRVVPVQDVHVQRVAPLHEVVQEIAKQRRRPVGHLGLEVQPGLAVEVPAEDRDRALGAQRRFVERTEVIRRVDQQRDALGARHRPAVVARPQERRRSLHRLQVRCGRRAAPAHAAVEIKDAAHYFVRTLAVLGGVAIGAGVCGAIVVVGESAMPRGNALSLVWFLIGFEAPAAA